jgi:hypothetical protein
MRPLRHGLVKRSSLVTEPTKLLECFPHRRVALPDVLLGFGIFEVCEYSFAVQLTT